MKLGGGFNIRDLGGLPAAAPAVLQRGRLLRCGGTESFSPGDVATLAQGGVRFIVDLRGPRERMGRQPPITGTPIQIVGWDYDERHMSVRHRLERGPVTAAAARSAMLDLYREMPVVFRSAWRDVLDLLARRPGAVLVACAAGKDRTGLTVATILSAAGVEWRVIVEDYLRTNTAVDLEQVLSRGRLDDVGVGGSRAMVLGLDPEIRRPILEAREEYLVAAFERMHELAGSTARYLEDYLGVAPEQLEALRRWLLVPELAG